MSIFPEALLYMGKIFVTIGVVVITGLITFYFILLFKRNREAQDEEERRQHGISK